MALAVFVGACAFRSCGYWRRSRGERRRAAARGKRCREAGGLGAGSASWSRASRLASMQRLRAASLQRIAGVPPVGTPDRSAIGRVGSRDSVRNWIAWIAVGRSRRLPAATRVAYRA